MTERTRTSRPRLTRGSTVSFDRLDELLDVPVAQWERNVKRLVREFRAKALRLELPPSRLDSTVRTSSKVIWTNLFEAQVKHMPRMDRAEEFRMARRYDFQKARVRDALLRAGHRPAVVDELVTRPLRAMPEPTRRAPAGAADHLARVRISEFYVRDTEPGGRAGGDRGAQGRAGAAAGHPLLTDRAEVLTLATHAWHHQAELQATGGCRRWAYAPCVSSFCGIPGDRHPRTRSSG